MHYISTLSGLWKHLLKSFLYAESLHFRGLGFELWSGRGAEEFFKGQFLHLVYISNKWMWNNRGYYDREKIVANLAC